MTLAAGFMASDGILLCADTLVSDGYTKQYRNKLFTWQGNGISVCFAIAGDANIATMAADNCAMGLNALNWDSQSFSDVYAALASTIRYVQNDYVDKVPVEDRERSRFYMLVGIYTTNSGHRLYVTNNAALSPVHEFECIGSGRSIGIYVLEPSYKQSMSINDLSVLALHAFAAAKERCDGVGGRSQFLSLRKGVISPVGEFDIESAENDVLEYRQACAALLADMANETLDNPSFERRLEKFADRTSTPSR